MKRNFTETASHAAWCVRVTRQILAAAYSIALADTLCGPVEDMLEDVQKKKNSAGKEKPPAERCLSPADPVPPEPQDAEQPEPDEDGGVWYTRQQMAEELGMSPSTLFARMKDLDVAKRFEARKKRIRGGRQFLFPQEALDFLKSELGGKKSRQAAGTGGGACKESSTETEESLGADAESEPSGKESGGACIDARMEFEPVRLTVSLKGKRMRCSTWGEAMQKTGFSYRQLEHMAYHKAIYDGCMAWIEKEDTKDGNTKKGARADNSVL